MDKELINFVEWLPENSELFTGLSIEETVRLVNELVESDDETLKQLVKQYKGMELFKKGGKLDYLLCLKKGGSMDCGCGKKIEKAQPGSASIGENGLMTQTPKSKKDLEYQDVRTSAGDGKAAQYITRNGRWQITDFDMPSATILGNGNAFKMAVKRNPQTGALGDTLIIPRSVRIPIPIDWTQFGNVARSAQAYKEGGELKNVGGISRKKAIDSADSRKEGRKQYRQNKKTMRDNGYRGKEMKQAARKSTIRQSFANRPVESTPIATPTASFVAQVPQIERPVTMSSRMEDNYGHLMGQRVQAMIGAEQASKFSDAFRIARNAGLLTFKWNGREYNTQLANPQVNLAADPIYGYSKPTIPEFVNVEEESFYEEPGPWQAY